jgi:hypothetical protein
MIAHPYRTAPVAAEPQRLWWRRALCAIGRHSLYLDPRESDVHYLAARARCEHCALTTTAGALDLAELVAAMRGMGEQVRVGRVLRRDALLWLDRSRDSLSGESAKSTALAERTETP